MTDSILHEVPKTGDDRTLGIWGKTTEKETAIGTIRATASFKIEIVTPKGEMFSLSISDTAALRDCLRDAEMAADGWRKIVNGQLTPRLWERDGKTWCEYDKKVGEIRFVNGRRPKSCYVCKTMTASRWEAVRIPWDTPALPVLCNNCADRCRDNRRGKLGKLSLVDNT